MRRSVGAMTGDVGTMTEATAALKNNTAEMANHFHTVERTVGHLDYNVNQMMRPMSILPR
jgi:hypothetical protein